MPTVGKGSMFIKTSNLDCAGTKWCDGLVMGGLSIGAPKPQLKKHKHRKKELNRRASQTLTRRSERTSSERSQQTCPSYVFRYWQVSTTRKHRGHPTIWKDWLRSFLRLVSVNQTKGIFGTRVNLSGDMVTEPEAKLQASHSTGTLPPDRSCHCFPQGPVGASARWASRKCMFLRHPFQGYNPGMKHKWSNISPKAHSR